MFQFNDVSFQSILHIPSLSIDEFKKVAVIGESGSGKSTFLKLLNLMISPTDGTIYFRGKNLNETDAVAHRRETAMLPQQPVLFGDSVEDNLTAGARFACRPIPDAQACEEALSRFSLKKALSDDASLLSGGEQQRLSLARMTLMESPILLLDEPTSALDEELEEKVMEQFMRFADEKNKTVIFVTHSHAIAESFSDAIIDFHHYSQKVAGA
ncbi:ATP-binding cassette domain-containing protein [Alteribacillus sp. HJP-4]|uniref:ABC transporter ATP-binding protein n=1 Tax=Alteribacillus sp. HJP-4 TaxID=2775394 RepID=UPI0035CD174B